MARKRTPREEKQDTYNSRFDQCRKRRVTIYEVSKMHCFDCHTEPVYEISPYAFSQGDKYTYYVCKCKGKGVWFEIVKDDYK